MKRISTSFFIVLSFAVTVAHAQHTKQILKKQVIDHFFTCTMDKMLDTLSAKYKLPIFYEREVLENYDVNARFFNETLLDVLKSVCNEHGLRYWIENDGTIYIMQRPDDLVRLRRLKKMRNNMAVIQPQKLDPPKGPPQKFKFAITGRVVDQNTGEALPGATVKIRNTDLAVMSNSSGNFTIMNVPSDTSVVEASFMGYQNDAFRLTHENVTGMLTLSLFPNMNNTLNEVEVVGKKAGVLNTDSKKVSVLQLTPAALDKLPSIGERDIMRSFQLMPGVSATNESSSGAYVRGGTPDQNLVTFDGFTVYQVDHLYGFFSAFNTNAVRDVDLYKGGYSAKYGGRLSSVTEIRGKDGNKNESNIGGDIGLLSTNIYAESPVGKKSTALVAFRRSYQGPLYDKIFGQFNTSTTTNNAPTGGGGFGGGRPGGGGFANQTTPSSYFYDVNAKYTYTPSTKNSFSWSLYNGTDNLDNGRKLNFPSFSSTTSSDLTVNDNVRSGNLGTSVKWTTNAGQKLFGNTVASYSGFYSDRNRGTTGSVTDSDATRQINTGMVEKNRLNDYSLKSDWEWRSGAKTKLLFGGYGSFLNIKYNYIQNDTTTLINQNNSGAVAGAFTELEYDPTSNLHIQPGLRTTYFSPTGKFYTEPRLSATYDVTNNFKLKGATGRFYQFTKQVTREDVISGDRNFWVLANNTNIPVAYADHFIAGFSVENDNFLFDVESYYKRLHGLSEYSIRQVGGNTGGGPGGGMMTDPNATTSVTENFYNGEGYSRGVEVLLQKKAGVYTGWMSYTLGEVKSKFPNYGDSYFSSNQDIRHEFKWVNMYHMQRWSFSAVFTFSTGHPYTAPLGSYTINTLDGGRMTYMSISAKNGERLPAYHRLDLAATYDLLKIDGRKVGSISFSLFNAYNHINTWYNEYYLQGNQIITTQVKYLGLTPNITLSLKLK